MGIGPGRAFPLGESLEPSANVRKEWIPGAGASTLLEMVSFADIGSQIEALPVLREIPPEKLLLPPSERGLYGILKSEKDPGALIASFESILNPVVDLVSPLGPSSNAV